MEKGGGKHLIGRGWKKEAAFTRLREGWTKEIENTWLEDTKRGWNIHPIEGWDEGGYWSERTGIRHNCTYRLGPPKFILSDLQKSAIRDLSQYVGLCGPYKSVVC